MASDPRDPDSRPSPAAPSTSAEGAAKGLPELFKTCAGIGHHPFFASRSATTQAQVLALLQQQAAVSSQVVGSMEDEDPAVTGARVFVGLRALEDKVAAVRARLQRTFERTAVPHEARAGGLLAHRQSQERIGQRQANRAAAAAATRVQRAVVPRPSPLVVGGVSQRSLDISGPTPRSAMGEGGKRRRGGAGDYDLDDMVSPHNAITPKFVERVKPNDITTPPVRLLTDDDIEKRRKALDFIRKR